MKKTQNQIFASLSPSKKRVMIALDVVAQLKAQKYTAHVGHWVILNFDKNNEESSLQKILHSKCLNNCNVCGIGSLFVSQIRFENKFKIPDRWMWGSQATIGDEDICPKLEKYFSKAQLDLIEVAFEGRSLTYLNDPPNGGSFHRVYGQAVSRLNSDQSYESAMNFFTGLADERMIKIMTNIAQNNGFFRPQTGISVNQWHKIYNNHEQ